VARAERPSHVLALIAVAILAVSCSRQAPTPPVGQTASPTSVALEGATAVFRGFTLIDGNGGAPLADAALVLQDGRITWVGPVADLKAPPGAAVQDLAGKYVMPGIIDLHTHIAESDGITQDPKTLFTRARVESNLRLYAQYGVTTVASLGTDQPLVYVIRDEQRRGRPRMARIFTAGRGFTTQGGYPTQPGGIPGVPYEVSTAADAAAAVDELAAHNPDFVKIWVDDHFGELPKIPLVASRGIIESSHRHKLRAVAHVFYRKDATELVDAGIDAFAHSVRDQLVDDAFAQKMKAKGTWLMSATLAREASMFSYAEPGPFLGDTFFTKALPPGIERLMGSADFLTRMKGDPHFREYPTYLKNAQRNLKRLVDAGVRFGFGTDTGTPSRFSGYGDHWEMQLMVEAGLTPMQVLTAATRSSAEFLNATDLGTIEKGKWADLLVLGADPLADIRNTRHIDAVYVAGNRIQ
jgi:imidazolonepropionase-like amidohydrolase